MRKIVSLIGSLALGALIVYTMRLPEHSTAFARISRVPVAQVPVSLATVTAAAATTAAPVTPKVTLIAVAAAAAYIPLPSDPWKRIHNIENCFSFEPDLDSPVIWTPNAVITAALKGDWEGVRKLIDAGAPVESTNEKGLTALMIAAQKGNLEAMRMLVERRARINFMDFEGQTALHYAMAAGK